MLMKIFRQLAVTVFCFVCCHSNLARSDPDVSGMNYVCNPETYTAGSVYASSVEDVLQDIPYGTADKGFNYYTRSTDDYAQCYAHGACNGEISPDDCYQCMETAVVQITHQYCPLKIGGHLQLQDCRVSSCTGHLGEIVRAIEGMSGFLMDVDSADGEGVNFTVILRGSSGWPNSATLSP